MLEAQDNTQNNDVEQMQEDEIITLSSISMNNISLTTRMSTTEHILRYLNYLSSEIVSEVVVSSQLSNMVPKTTKINGQSLSSDISIDTFNKSDIDNEISNFISSLSVFDSNWNILSGKIPDLSNYVLNTITINDQQLTSDIIIDIPEYSDLSDSIKGDFYTKFEIDDMITKVLSDEI